MKNDPLKQMMEWLALVIFATILAVIVFLLNGCGDGWNPEFYCAGSTSPITQKIVGGQPTMDRRATVRLIIDGRGTCSGVALDAHNVLTAAHCVEGRSRWKILFGDDYEPMEVTLFTIHPAYVRFPLHDLAILHSPEPIPGPFPVRVYDAASGDVGEPDLRESCDYILAQGYGKNDEGELGTLNELLMEVGGVSLYTLTTAAVEPNAGVCFGDSGGPLYAFVDGVMYLAGIASTSLSEECNFAGQHVHLVNYWPWVQENMKAPGDFL